MTDTNQLSEVLTNTVSVTTHITPQAAAYTFKEWAGVVAMVASGLHTAIILMSKFVDGRYGGFVKWVFNGLFGSDVPPNPPLTPPQVPPKVDVNQPPKTP